MSSGKLLTCTGLPNVAIQENVILEALMMTVPETLKANRTISCTNDFYASINWHSAEKLYKCKARKGKLIWPIQCNFNVKADFIPFTVKAVSTYSHMGETKQRLLINPKKEKKNAKTVYLSHYAFCRFLLLRFAFFILFNQGKCLILCKCIVLSLSNFF